MNRILKFLLCMSMMFSCVMKVESVLAHETVNNSKYETEFRENVLVVGIGESLNTPHNIMARVVRDYPGTWIKDNIGWFYLHHDGTRTSADWEFINGKWYYFNPSGYMYKGWLREAERWYYLDEGDGHMVTGWVYIVTGPDGSREWFYFEGNGAMKRGWLFLYNNNTQKKDHFYLAPNGIMVTGTYYVDNLQYVFDDTGRLVTECAPEDMFTIFGGDYSLLNPEDALNTVQSATELNGIIEADGRYNSTLLLNYSDDDMMAVNPKTGEYMYNSSIFLYRGHGEKGHLKLPDTNSFNPGELEENAMNNVDIAFLFCCYGAYSDSKSKSTAEKMIEKGAKAVYGATIETLRDESSEISRTVLNRMLMGYTLEDAVDYAKCKHISLNSVKYDAIRLLGNKNITLKNREGNAYLSSSYLGNVSDVDLKMFTNIVEFGKFRLYRKEYKGMLTTDYCIADIDGNIFEYVNNIDEKVLKMYVDDVEGSFLEKDFSDYFDTYYEILDAVDMVSYINGEEVPIIAYYIKLIEEGGEEIYTSVLVNSFTNEIIDEDIY